MSAHRSSGTRAHALRDLGEHVADSLDGARVESGGLDRVAARLASGEPVRRAPRRAIKRRAWLALAATLTVTGLSIALFVTRPPPPVTFAIEGGPMALVPDESPGATFLAAPADVELPVAFSDGTKMKLLPRARARVTETTDRGARVLLESGSLRADVVKRKNARWGIDAGPFHVRVTGTRFDVAWDPASETIAVALEHGGVVVSGCSLGAEGRTVSAGQRLVVSCKTPAPEASSATAIPSGAPALEPKPATSLLDPPSIAHPPDRAARPAVEPPELAMASANELLRMADTARYEGKHERARSALTALRRRFPGTPAAAAAAFELGRIAFDNREAYVEAADWFDTYLREQPQGGFAREALGRALEASVKAGDPKRTRELATRYLAAFPDGPHSRLARRTVFGDSQ